MFKRFTADQRGFTLMELLIAVAIVVVLAGVGIPVYLKFQAGAKHSEASTNLNGIKLSEEGYKLSNGTYLDCAASPRLIADLDETSVAWADLGTGFTDIGFTTSADVRFAYVVSGSTTIAFLAEATGDTDGDADTIIFEASQSEGPHLQTVGDED